MAILQAYLDEGEGVGLDTIKELRQSTDLSLHATKETTLSQETDPSSKLPVSLASAIQYISMGHTYSSQGVQTPVWVSSTKVQRSFTYIGRPLPGIGYETGGSVSTGEGGQRTHSSPR